MHYFQVTSESVEFVGSGLCRPECVLAHTSGCLVAPSWHSQGGVTWILPGGEVHTVTQSTLSKPLRPNGIALDAEGNALLAHLGNEQGGVFTLSPDGQVHPRVETVNGKLLPPTNYVVHDNQGRLWITVSTELTPRAKDYHADACSGFIAVAEPGQTDAKIVAKGLGYTNEIVIDESRHSVFVNETFGRRLTRFDLLPDGSLCGPETIVNFGKGTYPDGLALAADGSLWVTSILSNRVIVVQPDGTCHTVLEDADMSFIEQAEMAYQQNGLEREHLDRSHGTYLHNISNLAFFGANLQTACLGNLLGERIPCFRTPVAGSPMTHWEAPINGWLERFGSL